MSERNLVMNEEIVLWIKLLSNKIKIKEIQEAMDSVVGMSASLGEFSIESKKEILIFTTSKRTQVVLKFSQ